MQKNVIPFEFLKMNTKNSPHLSPSCTTKNLLSVLQHKNHYLTFESENISVPEDSGRNTSSLKSNLFGSVKKTCVKISSQSEGFELSHSSKEKLPTSQRTANTLSFHFFQFFISDLSSYLGCFFATIEIDRSPEFKVQRSHLCRKKKFR